MTGTPRALKITVNDATKYYGDADPAFTAEMEGKLEGDVIDIRLIREEGEELGEYKIFVSGVELNPNYEVTDMVTGVLTIVAKPLTELKKPNLANAAYTGKPIEPSITLRNGDKVLTEGVDYTITYLNNTDVGRAHVIITGMGNYTGTMELSFTIYDPNAVETAPKDEVLDMLGEDADADMSIVTDASGRPQSYELMVIPALEGDANHASIMISAMGDGSEARTLAMNMGMLAHLYAQEDARHLLFRNGSGTVSVDMTSMSPAALANELGLAAEELSRANLGVTISPLAGGGYAVAMELKIDGQKVGIPKILQGAKLCLAMEPLPETATVIYTDTQGAEHVLTAVRGIVPDHDDVTTRYDVLYGENAATVSSAQGALKPYQQEGLIVEFMGAGEYRIQTEA